jgi:Right handed beta helix region
MIAPPSTLCAHTAAATLAIVVAAGCMRPLAPSGASANPVVAAFGQPTSAEPGRGLNGDSERLSAALRAAAASGASRHFDASTLGALRLTQRVTIPAGVTLRLGAEPIDVATATAFVMESGAHLEGAGPGVAVLRYVPGAARPNMGMIFCRRCEDIGITGITLDGNRGANAGRGADGIRLRNTSRAAISGLAIRGFSGNGIDLLDPERQNRISSNWISDCGEDGTDSGHGIEAIRQATGTTDGLTIANNVIDSTSAAASGAEGIKVGVSANASNAGMQNVYEQGNLITLGASASATWGIENWVATDATFMDAFHVIGNTITGAGGVAGAAANNSGGISLGGEGGGGPLGSEVINNVLSYLGWIAIEDTFENVKVSGNVVNWTGQSDTDGQHWTRPFALGAEWANNQFQNTLAGAYRALMVITTTASVSNVSIHDNTFTTPAADGIDVIDNSSTGKTISVSIANNSFHMGRSVSDAVMRARGAALISRSAHFTINDVKRWVRVAGAGASGDLVAQIDSVANGDTANLDTPAARAVDPARALISVRPGTTAIKLTNRGIDASVVRGNRIFGMDGRTCDYFAIQVINGARANVTGNRYDDVNPICREQVPRSR